MTGDISRRCGNWWRCRPRARCRSGGGGCTGIAGGRWGPARGGWGLGAGCGPLGAGVGARGGITMDLVVRLREGAHHSGHWGGVLADPGFILAHALSTIVSREGRILVEGWTPKHVPESVRRACNALVFEDIPGLPEAD